MSEAAGSGPAGVVPDEPPAGEPLFGERGVLAGDTEGRRVQCHACGRECE